MYHNSSTSSVVNGRAATPAALKIYRPMTVCDLQFVWLNFMQICLKTSQLGQPILGCQSVQSCMQGAGLHNFLKNIKKEITLLFQDVS